jgi:hypothetical protein
MFSKSLSSITENGTITNANTLPKKTSQMSQLDIVQAQTRTSLSTPERMHQQKVQNLTQSQHRKKRFPTMKTQTGQPTQSALQKNTMLIQYYLRISVSISVSNASVWVYFSFPKSTTSRAPALRFAPSVRIDTHFSAAIECSNSLTAVSRSKSHTGPFARSLNSISLLMVPNVLSERKCHSESLAIGVSRIDERSVYL